MTKEELKQEKESIRRAPSRCFSALWIDLYGEDSWEYDWVWVYEFKRVDH